MTVPTRKIGQGILASALLLTALLPATAMAQGLRPSGSLGASGLGSSGLGSSLNARPASTGPRQADFIVVVVNSEPITNNEVLAKLVRTEQQLAQQGGALPPRDVLARQVLERMINEKSQVQLAREAGIKVDDAAVDQAELAIASQNQITVTELRRRLTQDGMSVSQFREDLRDQILLTKVRERELEAKARVTEVDIDQFILEKQGGADQANAEIDLGMVLVAVPENAEPSQVATLQARAESIAKRARAGEDFTALVKEFSDAPDRARNNGQLGLRAADRYPALFVEATRGLPKGGVSEPVRSGAGFHVLKLIEKSRASLPAKVVQSRARHILLRTGAQLSEAAAVERLADYRRRILAGQADFAQLAREHSQDASAKQGGDLGWVNPGTFVPEFEEVMDALKPGDLSQPLISRFGVHLIQLQERREQRLSAREQREVARQAVRMKKTEDAYATWTQEVRGRAYVEYRDPPQ